MEPARTASYLDPISLLSTGAAEIHRHGPRPRSTWPRREGSRCLLPSPPLARWQAQLVQTQTDLLYLGPMLPGSLSRQYKDPAAATGADGQLSYADHMRSRARYVRPEAVAPLKPLHANFRRFLGWSTAASIFPSKIVWSFCFLIPTSLQPDLRDLGWQEVWARR